VKSEQAFFGTREAIFRELADDFEESGADGVIKIL
jgi:hypothetical protein